MSPEVRETLRHIQRSIAFIFADCEGCDRAQFFDDRRLQQLCERNLSFIGEAVGRLRRHHPDIFSQLPDGNEYIGLRNVIVHGYDVIRLGVLWRIIQEELAELDSKAKQLINEAAD